MTWKKFFRPVNSVLPAGQRTVDSTSAYASTAKYNNWLPEVYSGPPDRLQRYAVYDQMNYDHEISAAVDTIADFGTECDEVSKLPLVIKFNDDPTPSEVQILEKSLNQWCRLNKINRRLWRMFRSVLVYGDQFFLRDPETFKLYWIDPAKVEKVIVNESDGKKIESYFVKDIDLNMKSLVGTNQLNKLSNEAFGSNSIIFSPPMQGNMNYVSGGYGGAGTANYQDGGATAVDAEHILQLSLTDGMNAAWPFGLSILEQIYKVYKQKELLEDAILIYRIHRAPERRVFFIDVGTMPPNKAQQYLERVRYEVQQKRIPSRTGGGANVVDSTYNPMCFDMSTRVPLLDGRTLSITELAEEYRLGKENWGYSCDPISGKIVPGNITWAGVTKRDAKVLKITLDDGNTITCTPEHKIPVLGKGFVEAKDLTTDDPLIRFNIRNVDGYSQIYDTSTNSWEYIHKIVGNFFKNLQKHKVLIFDKRHEDDIKNTGIHANSDTNDNTPHNIRWMNHDDLTTMQKFVNPSEWKNLTKDEEYQKLKSLHIEVKNYQSNSLVKYTEFVDKFVSVFDNIGAKSIQKIEYLKDKIDVGTITIDGNEVWHNYHTFALESGIFVKNSILEDYFFAVTCLTLDTQIPLLDGRTLELSELISEFEQGKENYTYTINQDTHEMIPGKIVWGGITRKNAELVEVLLDNGEKLRLTPDHRFIMRDGSEVEAQHLKAGDSLMPLYLNESRTSPKQKGKPYLRYVDNTSGKLKWVHTSVCPKTTPGKDTEIHHIDFNSRNNNPMNLIKMDTKEHRRLHSNTGTYSLQKQWNNPISRQTLINGMHTLYENRSEEFDVMLSNRNRKNGEKSRNSIKNKIHIRQEQEKLSKAKTIQYSVDMFNRVDELFDEGYNSLSKILPVLKTDEKFQTIFLENNKDIIRDNNDMVFKPGDTQLNTIVGFAGFNLWGDYKSSKTEHKKFSSKEFYNHKVVSVTFLKEKEDTGDITIESEGGYHNFATAAGVYVHNSEGRGSKVEVLPGGENLGDIDDLRYFNNKMLRALGVPSSYLPTGPEDGTAAVNDGRVGTAFIQEFRFSKVVARYQQQIIEPIDLEFKLFLKFRGVTIDNSLFEIEFTPPQSFSEYRQLELDSARINTFTALMDVPFISKRFVLKTYLAWSEEQLAENERMWKEEKSRLTKTSVPAAGIGGSSGLSDVGITSSGIDNMAPQGDLGGEEDTSEPAGAVSDNEVDNFGEQ